MNKVQSKKEKDDLAQNTEILQDFKKQVLSKLASPLKVKKEENETEQIKSFDIEEFDYLKKVEKALETNSKMDTDVGQIKNQDE